ncbi:MAG: serine/threonine-protein kinase [Gemmatimonadales bacterium]
MMAPALPDHLFLTFQQTLAGRYSLERELGRGGMGIVYLARDVRLDRPVALKLLPPDRAVHRELRERFLHEARMAARLAHPNIVAIHAVEEAGDFVFYAMRYVEGETLGNRLRRIGRLAPLTAARILRDTAYALAYAHAQRVIHRDIKPDNILLEADGDRVAVTDFGIACVAGDSDLTGGTVVGTPEYISPEQAAGLDVDGRSDLYSLGAVGFHCVTGRPPFGGGARQLIAQHLADPAPAVHAIRPEAPAALAQAIDRALRKSPGERFPSAEAFAETLSAGLSANGDLPVPVRVWVERGRELKGIYVIWSCFFYGVGTMALVGGMISGEWPWQTVVFIVLCAKATLAPWIGHGLWRISETRKAIEAGATLDDLRRGAAIALERREEELRYEASRAIHPLARLIRYATYAAMAGAIGALLGGIVTPPADTKFFFQSFGLLTMATVGGALFGLVFPGRRLEPRAASARLRTWFWKSPLGDLMGRISSIGLRPTTPWHSWHGTGAGLGSATGALFAALPEADRRALADLPEVIARLEAEAVRARLHLDAGSDAMWESRLERAVAAIETLRIGLLRMAADHAATGALTADLDAARALSDRIDYLVAGASEVADALGHNVGVRQNNNQAPLRHNPASTSLG